MRAGEMVALFSFHIGKKTVLCRTVHDKAVLANEEALHYFSKALLIKLFIF
jgi:hypothetical protein